MTAFDIRHWEGLLTSFLRDHPDTKRAASPLWRRRPTLSKRRHWHAVVRALESCTPEMGAAA